MSQTPGQKLKAIRESKGILLEEMAQKTRIRLEYLEAIESDDQDLIPSAVQMRGFLRLYAHELGVDLNKLKDQEDQAGQDGDQKPPEETTWPEIQEEELIHQEESEEKNNPDKTQDLSLSQQIEKPEENFFNEPTDIPETETTEHATAIFQAIGAKLQSRRKLLSLSHNVIADNLHIRQTFLESMEAGKFDALPSPVQARGMLANYVEFLNLDVDEILLEYAEGLQVKRLEKQKQNASKNKKSARELSPTRLRLKNFFSLDLLVITSLFLGFAVFVVWGVNRIMSTDNTELEVTDIPEVAEVLLATGSPTPRMTITPNGSPSPGETAEPGLEETGAEEPTPLFTPAENNNPINIVIIPRQRTWVQVTADDEIVFEGRLITGNVYDYSGDEFVKILTGNAGALQIYFNDEDIGSPGLIGQIVDLTFRETGLVQPTPTNTPTITQTPRPTPSPTVTPTATQTRMPTLTPTDVNDETN
jgi:cytoskeletal protein RodZ